ncbi:hypothetical protein ACHAWF_007086 [Thalassiosira exigua]
MDNLLETVHDSIAGCVEVAYKPMKLSDAVTVMKFETTAEFQEYVQEKREDWIVEEDRLTFQPPRMGSKAVDIPSMILIDQSLSYSTEFERIVQGWDWRAMNINFGIAVNTKQQTQITPNFDTQTPRNPIIAHYNTQYNR